VKKRENYQDEDLTKRDETAVASGAADDAKAGEVERLIKEQRIIVPPPSRRYRTTC
jgi:hypothetical protein